jgi:hypothetical protein
MWLRLPLLWAVACVASLHGTSIIMPDFAGIPNGWVANRYDPHSFSDVGTYQGLDNVLGIQITVQEGFNLRPSAYESTFYNTQGRDYAVSGGADTALAAALYIPSAWSDAANGSFRTDMWGVMTDGVTNGTDYPIIGFTNYGGTPRYRVWDGNAPGGWVDLATPVTYDAWTAFQIIFTGSSYVYTIDGAAVFTDSTINSSTGFSAVIMQAYNFYGDPSLAGANPVDYTAYWSHSSDSGVSDTPEPGTWGLLGSGLMVAGLLSRRRIVQRSGDSR